CGQASHLPWTF
nr:immunoglobulin light chain junction region [Macaca mulatta]